MNVIYEAENPDLEASGDDKPPKPNSKKEETKQEELNLP